MVRTQFGEKFPSIGVLLFPWKKGMLLVCQILNNCNYQVLFWFNFIKKWSLANVTHIWEIMYMTCLTICFTISFFFFAIADLKNFTWCNVIQQIKKVSPYITLLVVLFKIGVKLHKTSYFMRLPCVLS